MVKQRQLEGDTDQVCTNQCSTAVAKLLTVHPKLEYTFPRWMQRSTVRTPNDGPGQQDNNAGVGDGTVLQTRDDGNRESDEGQGISTPTYCDLN